MPPSHKACFAYRNRLSRLSALLDYRPDGHIAVMLRDDDAGAVLPTSKLFPAEQRDAADAYARRLVWPTQENSK